MGSFADTYDSGTLPYAGKTLKLTEVKIPGFQ